MRPTTRVGSRSNIGPWPVVYLFRVRSPTPFPIGRSNGSLYLNDGNWADYFYSDFSKAEDGPVRSLKLGVEEEAAITILTGDCLHHCSLFVSEASLQEHGLSDLGPEGIPLFLSLPRPFIYLFLLCVLICSWFAVCSPKKIGNNLSEEGKGRVKGRGGGNPMGQTALKRGGARGRGEDPGLFNSKAHNGG